MPFRKHNYDLSRTKERYTIKKFKFGAASVLVALAFLGGQQAVKAEAVKVSDTTTVTQSSQEPESELEVAQTEADAELEPVAEPAKADLDRTDLSEGESDTDDAERADKAEETADKTEAPAKADENPAAELELSSQPLPVAPVSEPALAPAPTKQEQPAPRGDHADTGNRQA